MAVLSSVGSVAGTAAAVKPRVYHVCKEIGTLTDLVSALEDMAEKVWLATGSVRRPGEIDEAQQMALLGKEETLKEIPTAPLADELRQLNHRLNRIGGKLSHILDNLEI